MQPDSSNIWLYLILLIVLIAVNAFFAMGEIAIISLNDNKIKKMAAEGHKKAVILEGMVAKPSEFLATIQVGVTLSGFLASAVAADTFAQQIVYAFRDVAVSPTLVRVVSLYVITTILSYFTLVFGELVPKRVAMANSERISFFIARPLSIIYKLERPFVLLLSWSTNQVLRLIGINPDQKPEEVTEEEIRMMVDVGNESGTIEESEREMINNVFEFDDRTAEDIMTHRTEMVAVELSSPLRQVIQVATEEGYSRIPVYEESLDDIVGILNVKDLLTLVLEHPDADFKLSDYMRKPLYVPENTRCTVIFQMFNEKKIQIAIVVDEYGGTAGMVTMEDLLESIVGNIQDEYDDEEEEISYLEDDTYSIDGMASLEEVEKLLGIHFPGEDEYDTLSGFLIDSLGYIPAQGDHPVITVGDYEFTVTEIDERRIEQVHVKRSPQKTEENKTDQE